MVASGKGKKGAHLPSVTKSLPHRQPRGAREGGAPGSMLAATWGRLVWRRAGRLVRWLRAEGEEAHGAEVGEEEGKIRAKGEEACEAALVAGAAGRREGG